MLSFTRDTQVKTFAHVCRPLPSARPGIDGRCCGGECLTAVAGRAESPPPGQRGWPRDSG